MKRQKRKCDSEEDVNVCWVAASVVENKTCLRASRGRKYLMEWEIGNQHEWDISDTSCILGGGEFGSSKVRRLSKVVSCLIWKLPKRDFLFDIIYCDLSTSFPSRLRVSSSTLLDFCKFISSTLRLLTLCRLLGSSSSPA